MTSMEASWLQVGTPRAELANFYKLRDCRPLLQARAVLDVIHRALRSNANRSSTRRNSAPLSIFFLLAGVCLTAHAQPTEYEVPLTSSDYIEQTCASNPRLNGARVSYETSREQTNELVDFLIPDPSPVVASYISSAAIKEQTLEVQIVSKALYVGRRGRLIKTVEVKSYEARPILGIVAHTLTLGLFFITSPINSAQAMVGCTDRRVEKKTVEISKSMPTEQYEWRDFKTPHRVRISGLGEQYDLDTAPSAVGEMQAVTADLRSGILKATLDGPTTLNVECSTCDLQQNNRASQFTDKSRRVSLIHDFRPLQKQMLEVQRQAEEEAARVVEQQRKQEAEQKEREEKLRQAELARQRKIERDALEHKRQLEEDERQKKQLREKQEQIFKL